jgi:hypothetical protein
MGKCQASPETVAEMNRQRMQEYYDTVREIEAESKQRRMESELRDLKFKNREMEYNNSSLRRY